MIGARFALVVVCLLPSTIAAQRGDAFSVVGAVLGVELQGRDFAGTVGGLGYEVQARFAASGSRSSIGAGLYATTHASPGVVVRGTFLEFRVASETDSGTVTPYVTARLSHLNRGFGGFPAPGGALGAGAGAVLAVAPGLQLDGSATLARVWLPATDNSIAGRGTTLTLRVGAAVRLGG